MKRIVAVLAIAAIASTATAQVASDSFDSNLGLLSFTQTPLPGAFTSGGDGFEVYQIGDSIPYAIVDDSGGSYPGDTLGIIDSATKTDKFFGICDLSNGDNPAGTGVATWVFDIAGATGPLGVSIDMGAMGDFEGSGADYYDWTYSIDGAPAAALFTSSVGEDTYQDYTLAGGAVVSLDDPLFVNGTMLSNVLQTLSAPIAGTGSQLTLTLNAKGDGGSEAVAFDNIVVTPEPATLSLLGVGALALLRRKK